MNVEHDTEKARRLRAARALTGLDQTEFAKLIGVSRSIVSQYERGTNTKHSHPFLLAWAYHSGVTLEWVETGQDPVPVLTPDSDRYTRARARKAQLSAWVKHHSPPLPVSLEDLTAFSSW